MGQALYRKYRPRKLSDVVGQSAVTETLAKAIKSGKISHAYLFSGPRGVGKTSVARILAHEINKLKYSDESVHLDIIEIDGASTRRIDEVRDLREKVHIAPSSAQYKVYIIDEVHMLTKEAFNALLKTLEEPPAHCIFILATTEAHKLPETITSRTQRFSFKPISPALAAERISQIAAREKIDIEPEALELLADLGDGSFRDSLSLLDQLSSAKGKLTHSKVAELIGYPPQKLVADIEAAVFSADLGRVVELCQTLRDRAISPTQIAKELSKNLRRRLIDNPSDQTLKITKLLKSLLGVANTSNAYEALEISLLETAARFGQNLGGGDSDRSDAWQSTPKQTEIKNTSREARSSKSGPAAKTKKADFSLGHWPAVLAETKNRAGGLYSALRLARPHLEGSVLRLVFDFSLHYKKVAKPENIHFLERLIKDQTGTSVKIEAVVDKTSEKTEAPQIKVDRSGRDTSIETISNIFGSVEMLES